MICIGTWNWLWIRGIYPLLKNSLIGWLTSAWKNIWTLLLWLPLIVRAKTFEFDLDYQQLSGSSSYSAESSTTGGSSTTTTAIVWWHYKTLSLVLSPAGMNSFLWLYFTLVFLIFDPYIIINMFSWRIYWSKGFSLAMQGEGGIFRLPEIIYLSREDSWQLATRWLRSRSWQIFH